MVSKMLRGLGVLLLCVLCFVPGQAQVQPDWVAAQKPFRIADNLYYVGSKDLAAYLVTTPAGNILINGNLESSPPQIRASVETLGFKWADTKIVLNSQGHFDHVAGVAAIVKQTGAKVMTMEGDVALMQSGGKSDFSSLVAPYPPVHVDHVLHDGDTVRLGGAVLTAHKTAGHTRGCTTWTMDVHEGGRLLHVVIVGGTSPLSDYRLVDATGHRESYPGIERDFEHTFVELKSLPCDIFLGAHGLYFDMQAKLARMPQAGEAVWIDPAGYKQFVGEAQAAFEKRLAEEKERIAKR